MINYELSEQILNAEAKKIIYMIKEDYYDNMSNHKKKVINDLLESNQIVLVNKGISIFKDNTLAHGGRALKDGKIHFYPDARKFKSDEEMIEKCKAILPHEIFHYFIQPDNLKLNTQIEREMASFYTEGLVEKEARKFCKRHKEVAFEKANYGYNINFVNSIQNFLGASSYEVIFSENDYLKNIGKYVDIYKQCLERKNDAIKEISKIIKNFPETLQKKLFNKAGTIVLQNGSMDGVTEKLKLILDTTQKDLTRLEEENNKE